VEEEVEEEEVEEVEEVEEMDFMFVLHFPGKAFVNT